jgi:hypothetical protein
VIRKRRAWPGGLPARGFSGPGDFNAQLADWLVRANSRQHRGLGCRPADQWDADKAAMLGLRPVAPVTRWRLCTRLPRDYYVRVDSNDYPADTDVQQRALPDYDRILGISDQGAA